MLHDSCAQLPGKSLHQLAYLGPPPEVNVPQQHCGAQTKSIKHLLPLVLAEVQQVRNSETDSLRECLAAADPGWCHVPPRSNPGGTVGLLAITGEMLGQILEAGLIQESNHQLRAAVSFRESATLVGTHLLAPGRSSSSLRHVNSHQACGRLPPGRSFSAALHSLRSKGRRFAAWQLAKSLTCLQAELGIWLGSGGLKQLTHAPEKP